ncbi:hypothetical protein [Thorsellia anophelis]|uniref:Exopolyphosphatase / guanosine-5'-triphosphate,3'-diphosphate pyrophosphatase n=1 Tax=Thorsellia anophelis DSM 18579 TaxID=1123402 RepID=A0A1I0CC64_9GAMM|nr:hypothetical protein [Thorsellia anophelis]SET16523.1 exopolyphosphatase / guanosine-5'-triphosphate,3'-diphosphate pyrophosphatase [Thorsellia anophelis DSM 18579]
MIENLPRDNDLFAIIDLGSNSFHLLIARFLHGRLHPIQRVRRKVQLASGLDTNNLLNEQSIKRGLECIAIFADRVGHFNPVNVRAVATATLRLAHNREQFISRAERLLGHKIEVIDGEKEASLIYLGASLASHDQPKRLVIDIGGASTEIIIGDDLDIRYLKSLSVGCVTWQQQFFTSKIISLNQFDEATNKAKLIFLKEKSELSHLDWDVALSACGTIQTLNEIMIAQRLGSEITLDILYKLKDQIIQSTQLGLITVKGLFLDKAVVFTSGLSILIGLFEALEIQTLVPTDGALREGLLASFEFTHQNAIDDNAAISYIQNRYQVDVEQANRVQAQLERFILSNSATITLSTRIKKILRYCIALHEIGLVVDLKNTNQHASYLIHHIPQLGLTSYEKILISLWLQMLNPQKIKVTQLVKQSVLDLVDATLLSIMIKLAVISCSHRDDRFVAPFVVKIFKKNSHSNQIIDANNLDSIELIELQISKSYLLTHPLVSAYLQELIHEIKYEVKINIKLSRL